MGTGGVSAALAPVAPIVRVFPDAAALGRAAAAVFVERAGAAIAARGRFSVALAGGSTPRAMYRELAAPTLASGVDWTRVHVFFGDERAVPPGDPASNYGMASAALLDHVPIPRAQVRRLPADDADLERAARAYEDALRAALGDPPALDLALLGMGADGHTASIFPGTPAAGEARRLVVRGRAPVAPHDRLTLTAPAFAAARAVLFLVTGADKAAAAWEVLCGPRDPGRFPAQLPNPASGDRTWFLDRAAAARLPAEMTS